VVTAGTDSPEGGARVGHPLGTPRRTRSALSVCSRSRKLAAMDAGLDGAVADVGATQSGGA